MAPDSVVASGFGEDALLVLGGEGAAPRLGGNFGIDAGRGFSPGSGGTAESLFSSMLNLPCVLFTNYGHGRCLAILARVAPLYRAL